MKTHRKKRLINVLLLSFLSGAGVLMVLYALNSNLDYFFTPSELLTEEVPSNRRVKVGGMVKRVRLEEKTQLLALPSQTIAKQ